MIYILNLLEFFVFTLIFLNTTQILSMIKIILHRNIKVYTFVNVKILLNKYSNRR